MCYVPPGTFGEIVTNTHSIQPPRRLLLVICYIGFISLGLPDTLIGVAWPSVRQTFGLRQSDVSWIFFGSGSSYFLSSFFAGRLLKAFNVGVLLAISCSLVALADFNFSFARVWPLFALGAILHGLGSGAIDAGLNHYVANHFSARHMNWLHACYSLGAMLAPLIMTAAIARWNSWRLGYLVAAVVLLSLSLLFLFTKRQWDDRAESSAGVETPGHSTIAETLRVPRVWLHILLFFVYTGLEVALGQWSFTVLTEGRGIDREVAGVWVAIYWGSIFGGRVILGFIVDRMGIDRLIRLSIVTTIAGTVLFVWNPFHLASPIALGLAGFGLASIFPCLMTRTPQRFGKARAAHAIGFQVGAAMLGAAILPSVTGFIAEQRGIHWVPATILLISVMMALLHETVLFASREEPIA